MVDDLGPTSGLEVCSRTFLHWRKQGAHHEVRGQVVPGFGRKHHRVTGAREPHQLDLDTVRLQVLGERESLAGVGDAIRSSVGEKQPQVTHRRNGLAGGYPRRQRRHAVHDAGGSADMVGHTQRDPPPHGMTDQTYGQVAEALGDLIKGPACISQRRLLLTVPATHRVPKACQCDSTLSGANYAATKRDDAQDRRIEGSNRKEAVRSAAVQKQHDRLGGRVITSDAEAGRTGHTVRLFGVPVNWLGPI